jgi:MFS family permease
LTTIDLQTLYIFHSFAAAAVSAALAVYLIPRWSAPNARCLSLLMGSVAVWSLCYGMEFKSTGLADKLFWVRAEYLGAAWVGVFYFRFAMALTGRLSWLHGALNGVLFIILSMPYAILTGSLPANKMGVYMGIFNFFIVIPQILAASILGFLVKHLFDGQTILALVLGGVSMIAAGFLTLLVEDKKGTTEKS